MVCFWNRNGCRPTDVRAYCRAHLHRIRVIRYDCTRNTHYAVEQAHGRSLVYRIWDDGLRAVCDDKSTLGSNDGSLYFGSIFSRFLTC